MAFLARPLCRRFRKPCVLLVSFDALGDFLDCCALYTVISVFPLSLSFISTLGSPFVFLPIQFGSQGSSHVFRNRMFYLVIVLLRMPVVWPQRQSPQADKTNGIVTLKSRGRASWQGAGGQASGCSQFLTWLSYSGEIISHTQFQVPLLTPLPLLKKNLPLHLVVLIEGVLPLGLFTAVCDRDQGRRMPRSITHPGSIS